MSIIIVTDKHSVDSDLVDFFYFRVLPFDATSKLITQVRKFLKRNHNRKQMAVGNCCVKFAKNQLGIVDQKSEGFAVLSIFGK